MEARRLTSACCFALLACALFATSASAASPAKPGKRYDGPAPGPLPTTLVVSKDASRVSKYYLPVRVTCSNHTKRIVFLDEGGEPRATIDPAGRFAFTTPTQTGHLHFKGKRVKARFKSSVTGHFDADSVARGSITTRIRAGKVKCKGTHAFAAFLDGTRGAAYRNATAATGRYTAKGRRLKIRAFRVNAPGRLLSGLSVNTRDRCRRGTFRTGFTYQPLILHAGRINLSERVRSRIGGGQVARERYRLTVRLYRSGGAYRVKGTFRDTARIYRHAKRLDRCTSGTRHFTGRFRSGPKNLF